MIIFYMFLFLCDIFKYTFFNRNLVINFAYKRYRFNDRPMGYKEFKIVSGDTIYNQN